MTTQLPEPWLRGPLQGVHPLLAPVFFSFAQVREDLEKHMTGITCEQLWQSFEGGALGFHLRHLAGSVDRLTTYLMGENLSAAQLDRLQQEAEPDRERIREHLSGNYCRCTGYHAIVDAIETTARMRRGLGP